MTKIKYFMLTGDPGVGKTTLTKKLCSLVNEMGLQTSGFYTEEVRRAGVREGFDVVSLDGRRGCLARDCSRNGPVKFKVGKYGVRVEEFENVALPSLKEPEDDSQPHLLVIDEIGTMELMSASFRARIFEIFKPGSSCIVLATIPSRSTNLLIESLRDNRDAKVWMVTRENRNTIHEDILKEMKITFNFNLFLFPKEIQSINK
ncbi:nucleoside-triphosphatase THEP1 [Ostrinia nubilalis]|uniref:nucleoside-triphosphatase THEP1 n=1 Tax=Ostrinia nubilalis TaxID=29057 RepID=UPI0030824B32